jgi:hypothetical protein
MIAVAFVLLAQAAKASPPPALPKTIIRIKSSPVCSAFRQLVLPLALVQKNNHGLMRIIQRESDAYRKASDAYFARNAQLLHSANIDAAATTMLQNLTLMDALLARSWEQSPKGRNPKVDALRQRVQNIVDLQRAVANREVQFGGFLKDIDGLDEMAASMDAIGTRTPPVQIPNAVQVAASASPPPPPENDTSIALDLDANAPPGGQPLPEDDPRVPASAPNDFAAKDLTRYSFRSLENVLENASIALVPIAGSIMRDCGGTSP